MIRRLLAAGWKFLYVEALLRTGIYFQVRVDLPRKCFFPGNLVVWPWITGVIHLSLSMLSAECIYFNAMSKSLQKGSISKESQAMCFSWFYISLFYITFMESYLLFVTLGHVAIILYSVLS